MILDSLNVIAIVLTIIGLIFFIVYLVKMIKTKTMNDKKIMWPFICLILGIGIGMSVFFNSNLIEKNVELYANSQHPIPLSVTLISGAKTDYYYNHRYVEKVYDNGEIYFKLKKNLLQGSTNILVIQKYIDDFGVWTVNKQNMHIHRN
jgi:hypothetical protein